MKRVRWEGTEALSPGKHVLEFDVKYDGLGAGTLAFNNMSGIGRAGAGTLRVDGKEVASQKMEHSVPLILQWNESFDIGSDTGTSVCDQDYQVPFTFTGKLDKLTLKLDRPQLSASDIKLLEQAGQRDNGSCEQAGRITLPATCVLRCSRHNQQPIGILRKVSDTTAFDRSCWLSIVVVIGITRSLLSCCG